MSEALKLNDGGHSRQSSSPARGWQLLVCPACGDEESLTLALHDLDGFTCAGCGAEHSRCDIEAWLELERARIEKWQRVLAWMDQAPARED